MRHWATETLWKWLAEGCATKLEAKQCEQKRLDFLQVGINMDQLMS